MEVFKGARAMLRVRGDGSSSKQCADKKLSSVCMWNMHSNESRKKKRKYILFFSQSVTFSKLSLPMTSLTVSACTPDYMLTGCWKESLKIPWDVNIIKAPVFLYTSTPLLRFNASRMMMTVAFILAGFKSLCCSQDFSDYKERHFTIKSA